MRLLIFGLLFFFSSNLLAQSQPRVFFYTYDSINDRYDADTICVFGFVPFHAINEFPNPSANWYLINVIKPTDTIKALNNLNPIIYFNDTGFFHLYWKGFSNQTQLLDEFTGWRVYVKQCPPVADFSIDKDTLCGGGDIHFTNTSKAIYSTYEWYFEGGSPATFSGKDPPTVTFPYLGLHSVKLVVTNSAGVDSISKTVFIAPPMRASDTAFYATINFGESINLYACAVGTSYTWSPNLCNNCSIVTIQPKETETTIGCTITNEYGCIATCHYNIHTEGITGTLYTPNAFSPNGNGNNDVFQVFGKNIKLVRLQIFNRWGEKVFDAPDISQAWDGKYKNELQESGVYVYTITYFSGIETTARETKGSVTLIR